MPESLSTLAGTMPENPKKCVEDLHADTKKTRSTHDSEGEPGYAKNTFYGLQRIRIS